MTFNILIWASIIWIVPLICYMLTNEAKFKKNIAVGVTLPFEAREDEQVQAILKRYRRQQIAVSIVLYAIAVPCIFVKGINITMTLWCIWIDLCIILPNIFYVRNNIKLKKLKSEKGWKQDVKGDLRVDIAAIPPDEWLSPWVFLPAVLLCLLPMIWDTGFLALYVTFAASRSFLALLPLYVPQQVGNYRREHRPFACADTGAPAQLGEAVGHLRI